MRSMRSVLRNLARGASVKRWDVVYFGSTSLHMLQLLPLIKWRGWPAARDLGRELAKAVDAVSTVGACPVFMTGHWLCSREFLKRRDESVEGEFPSQTWELERLRRFLGDESNAWAARKAAILRMSRRTLPILLKSVAAITSDRDEAAACSKLVLRRGGLGPRRGPGAESPLQTAYAGPRRRRARSDKGAVLGDAARRRPLPAAAPFSSFRADGPRC